MSDRQAEDGVYLLGRELVDTPHRGPVDGGDHIECLIIDGRVSLTRQDVASVGVQWNLHRLDPSFIGDCMRELDRTPAPSRCSVALRISDQSLVVIAPSSRRGATTVPFAPVTTGFPGTREQASAMAAASRGEQ